MRPTSSRTISGKRARKSGSSKRSRQQVRERADRRERIAHLVDQRVREPAQPRDRSSERAARARMRGAAARLRRDRRRRARGPRRSRRCRLRPGGCRLGLVGQAACRPASPSIGASAMPREHADRRRGADCARSRRAIARRQLRARAGCPATGTRAGTRARPASNARGGSRRARAHAAASFGDERLDPLRALAQRRKSGSRSCRARARAEGRDRRPVSSKVASQRTVAARTPDGGPDSIQPPARAARAATARPTSSSQMPRLGSRRCARPERGSSASISRSAVSACAGDVRERAVAGAAEVMQVADERAARPVPGSPRTSSGHVGQARVERAQQLGQLEIGEPAREARRDHLAPRALRERRPLRRRRPRRAARARRRAGGTRGSRSRADRTARALPRRRASRRSGSSARAGDPGALAVGELELGLPVSARPSTTTSAAGAPSKIGSEGRPTTASELATRRTSARARAVLAVDDPDGRHEFRRDPESRRGEDSNDTGTPAQSACQIQRRSASAFSAPPQIAARTARLSLGNADPMRPRRRAGSQQRNGGEWAKIFPRTRSGSLSD